MHWIRWTTALALCTLGGAAPAARAQDKVSEQVVVLCNSDEDGCVTHRSSQGRGRLGLLVRTRANPETDSIGAYVEGVTPDGPAQKAGIREGDLITRFEGKTLAARGAEDESRPGRRLIELASALQPGDTVRLEYRRGREPRTATVVAERLPRIALRGDLRDLDLDLDLELPRLDWLHHLPRHGAFAFHLDHGLPGVKFAELNPDLGAYFGATEGILVLDVPKDTPLGLKAGDVIVSIDGRKPSGPGHARRILASYEPGEKVRLDVLRQRKRTSVEGKIPERASFRWQRPDRTDREDSN